MDNMQPTMTVNKYGDRFFRVNGELHRTDGPAVEWTSGKFNNEEWWLNGVSMSFDNWIDRHPCMTDKQKTLYRLQYG
jgi:hypothetical protein|tara:strand:- start:804 stop:1034 length:231 start_codon:yes stop_codon:yes gene_type:complete